MIRWSAPGLAVIVVAAAVLLAIKSAPAHAVSPAAEALFQDGRRLLAAGQTDEACARFAESYAAEASSGTLLNLALCHDKQGKTATAWAEYRGAARLARNQGREDRAGAADEKVAALEAKLPRLTLIPSKPVPGLKIATEDGSLGEGGWGVAVPIDPGVHQVTVTAPGYHSWRTTVEMKDADQRTLEIPDLEAEPVPAAEEQTPPTPNLISLPGLSAVPERRLSGPVVALGSLALVGLAGGAIFALNYQSENGEAKTLCPLDVCPNQTEKDRHERLVADAGRDLAIGLVAVGMGGAALLTSAYLWWRSGAPGSIRGTAGARVSVGLMTPARGLCGDVNVEW